MTGTKCFQAKAGQLSRQWYHIDADGAVVGRLAAQIAPLLMGKHRPTYTPHIDTGDYVIVTNVDRVVFTGNKWQQKTYTRYSGYPGGQKSEAAWKLFARHPERILHEAVRRMMPKTKMGRHMLAKLKLYVGPNHPHQAQQPIELEAIVGRPTSAGALFAPKASPPKPKARKERPKAAEGGAIPAPAAPIAQGPEAAPTTPGPATVEATPALTEAIAMAPGPDAPHPVATPAGAEATPAVTATIQQGADAPQTETPGPAEPRATPALTEPVTMTPGPDAPEAGGEPGTNP